MTKNGGTKLVHGVLSCLLALTLQATRAHAQPLPESVQAAIDQCERLEYAEPAEALRIADHGLTLDPQMTPAQRGLLLACRAWSQMQTGEMNEAREQTLEIDRLAGEMADPDDPRDRVGLLIRLASLHYRGGDPVSALEVMDRALELTRSHGLDEDLPHVLGNLAIYLTESGQFKPAIEHFERILELAEGNPSAASPQVPVRYNLARALLLDDRPEEALPHLQWLISAMESAKDPRLATAVSMTGSAWRKLGDFEQAEQYLNRAQALHQQFDNPGELSGLRGEQALLALDRGRLAEAEAYARQALSLARSIEYERSILEALTQLVDILALRGNYAEALTLHREYAERNQTFLEENQRSRLDALESQLGMERQAREIDELRQTSAVQQLQLRQESFRRQMAWVALLAVLVMALLISILQRAQQQRLLRVSRTDGLTGLANRRHLTFQIQGSASTRGNRLLMLLDLDHFKQVNDRWGHDIGDRVLLEVSGVLRRVAEANGAMCGRWGGEEFALFLPGTDAQAAASLAEQLRREIADLQVEDGAGGRLSITASLGFAPVEGLRRDSGQELWEPALKCADQLLYRAKHAGRNRGFGVWPAHPGTEVNPLAMDAALDSGELQLLSVPARSPD
ncbi:MAG: diguanylate cyclase [Thermoanaerobaculia bacterium]|nr:diguanylate cyclase [Thermoanaerobaculia bacterium]